MKRIMDVLLYVMYCGMLSVSIGELADLSKRKSFSIFLIAISVSRIFYISCEHLKKQDPHLS